MKHKLMPVVTISALICELKLQYDIDTDYYALVEAMWWDTPKWGSFQDFLFADGAEDPLVNSVCSILQDSFPGYDSILIQVT